MVILEASSPRLLVAKDEFRNRISFFSDLIPCQSIAFFGVAFFATGDHVGFGAFAPPDNGHFVIHCQFV